MAKFGSKTQSQETAIFASSGGEGVHGESTSLVVAAIAGIQSKTGTGSTGAGVFGESRGEKGAGIVGIQSNTDPAPVLGPWDAAGIKGESLGRGAGVVGLNLVKADPGPGDPVGSGGRGGFFKSMQKEGIVAETESLTHAAIAGYQNNPNGTGAAIYGECIIGADKKNGAAGFFRGNVIISGGDLSFDGADCAEHFTIKEEVIANPGTVMAFCGTGELVPCVGPYEKKVVGVVAGAGSLRPGIIMDKQEEGTVRRQPIALVGKVFCKVDASYAAIEVGDLLTSSATPGHAMKASDTTRAFGAVIGKAMAPLSGGLGLIPIFISLQ